MKHNLLTRIGRILLLAAMIVPLLSLPSFVQAASVAPSASHYGGLLIQVTAVEVNSRITVQGTGFPANVDFSVRIGPFYNFWKQGEVVKSVNSGSGGNFQFDVDLPDSVKDVKLVTIRLDSTNASDHFVAYNAFTNATNGTIGATAAPTTPTPTTTGATRTPTRTPSSSGVQPTLAPTSTKVPTGQSLPIVESGCKITAITPNKPVPPGYDFDAVWTVQNTGSINWDNHAVDIVYLSGTNMGKGSSDLPKYLKPGDDAIDVRADMVAPTKEGTYTTVFQVHGDRGNLCSLPLTLTVVK
jgi:hypothetical protein